MSDRVTRRQIEQLFRFFCEANGFSLAKSYNDVGGFALDYYAIGGGYQIVRIANTGGGHATPFGLRRYKPREFADLLRFSTAVAQHHEYEKEARMPGRPYSQYAQNGLTLKDAQEKLRALGMVLTKRDGEYRVNFKNGAEATAAYDSDLASIVGTGMAMAREGNKHLRSNPSRRKKFKAPFHVHKWEERDRLHILLADANDEEVASWWDDDARQMFEDGFFNARRLESSVEEYARSVGLI